MLDPFSLVGEEEPFRSGELGDSVSRLPAATFWAFVGSAVLAQAGLFAASLGLMLGLFRGQWTLGGGLFLGGCIALIATVALYRWHERRA